MSSSPRPRTRAQLAQYMINVHSELKRKRLVSNSVVGSKKTSSEIKESDNSRSVKKTRNAGVKSCFSEGNGKRKSDSNVDRTVRKKVQFDLSDLRENDDCSDGFVYEGELVVENGREFRRKSSEKDELLTKKGVENGKNGGKKSSVSNENGKKKGELVVENGRGFLNKSSEKDDFLMKKGVENGKNGGKKSSVSNENGKKKGKEKECRNVVSFDISDDDDDDDDDDDGIVFMGDGSLCDSEDIEKAASFIKKGVESAKNRGKKSSVASGDTKKNGKEKRSNVGSSDKVLRSGNGIDISDGSGNDDGIVFLGETIVISDSSSSASSGDNEESDGSESEMKAASGSTSCGSHEDNDDDGSSSETSRDLKSMSVSDGGDSDVNSQPVNSVGLNHKPQNDNFVGLEINTSDSENSGGDSDGLMDRSDDLSMSELESSSEEAEDDSDVEFIGNEPSSSDDSSEIWYSSSDDNGVEYVSESDNGTEEIEDKSAFVEKTLRSGKKIKGMESLRDGKDVEHVSDRDVGENEDNEIKDNGVFVEKIRRGRKKIKGIYWKKDNNAGINKGYRSDKGNYAESGLRKKKSRKKDDQCGKSALPQPIKERGESGSSTDYNPEPLIRKCSGEKKWSSKEEVMNLGRNTSRSARNADLIRMLESLNEGNINVKDSGFFKEPQLLKFRFEDEVDPPPEKSEREKELDSLFLEMNLCLRASEMKSAHFYEMESDNISSNVDQSPAASCGRGEHYPVLDEQIGTVCKFCGAIVLEIKDILPPWYIPRSRRQERKYFDESLSSIHGEYQFQDSSNAPNKSFMHDIGTVWDLVPGFEKDMFPHQREGIEFLWKKIAGDIAIEKLPESLPDEGRGGIISHAPGTGKTRLAVVFLLSLLKRYPDIRPVIIAPKVILATWEKEFVKWVDLSFHNMNHTKLSGRETRFGGGIGEKGVRMAKLLSWMGGGGVLGISYPLFASLASKGKKGADERAIWKTLVKQPGLLVLDEGHIPRTANTLILKAIKKVRTKRCIILSGTPFQNSFEELKHMLCLVNSSFHKMDNSSWKGLTEGKDELEEIRSMLEPYVHLYEGSVLQKSLFGQKRVAVHLRHTELQEKLMNAAMEQNNLTKTHLVSCISVHPAVLMLDKEKKFISSQTSYLHDDKLQKIESSIDDGVKLKFVMNLVQLADALGERVLVFSLYLDPLIFIKEQLKTHFSWSEGKEVLFMNGNLSEKQRQVCISLLNNDSSEAKVFLAAVKACSEGISLVGASRVVLLDTVWNPSVERQAISRAYRLGQKKTVYVYRLITCGLEVRQYEQQARKVYISKSIFSRLDGQADEIETSREILEDKVLEQMLNLETLRNIIDNIVPEETDFSESFRFTDL